jgi:hypothetical protein
LAHIGYRATDVDLMAPPAAEVVVIENAERE